METKRIDHDNHSEVMSFAQSEMVETFLYGINPKSNVLMVEVLTDFMAGLQGEVIDAITDLTEEQRARWKAQFASGAIDEFEKLIEKLERDRQQRHFDPIKAAIASMPKDELASAAARLVGLNSFQKRLSLAEETVGGPIDVAVISKGDGFVWIDRKHYFRRELNHHFFANYYRAPDDDGDDHDDEAKSESSGSGTRSDHARSSKPDRGRQARKPVSAPARRPGGPAR